MKRMSSVEGLWNEGVRRSSELVTENEGGGILGGFGRSDFERIEGVFEENRCVSGQNEARKAVFRRGQAKAVAHP